VGDQSIPLNKIHSIEKEKKVISQLRLFYKDGVQKVLYPYRARKSKFIDSLYSYLLENLEGVRKQNQKNLESLAQYMEELSQSYDVMAFSTIANNLNLAEIDIREHLEKLIRNNQLDAKISGDRVRFGKESLPPQMGVVTNETLEKIKQIIQVSDRIKLDMMKSALKIDTSTFNEKVFDWAAKFGFTISGDEIIINKDTVNEFMDALDEQFTAWSEKEVLGSDKLT